MEVGAGEVAVCVVPLVLPGSPCDVVPSFATAWPLSVAAVFGATGGWRKPPARCRSALSRRPACPRVPVASVGAGLRLDLDAGGLGNGGRCGDAGIGAGCRRRAGRSVAGDGRCGGDGRGGGRKRRGGLVGGRRRRRSGIGCGRYRRNRGRNRIRRCRSRAVRIGLVRIDLGRIACGSIVPRRRFFLRFRIVGLRGRFRLGRARLGDAVVGIVAALTGGSAVVGGALRGVVGGVIGVARPCVGGGRRIIGAARWGRRARVLEPVAGRAGGIAVDQRGKAVIRPSSARTGRTSPTRSGTTRWKILLTLR